MNNYLLILVAVLGLVSGYFVGDYRGRAAREALENTIRTGEHLQAELQSSVKHLKTELETVQNTHEKELDQSRKDYEKRMGEWQTTKKQLDATIRNLNEKMTDADARLGALRERLDSVSPEERSRLEKEIAHLQDERDRLQRTVQGNVCLKTQVPGSVLRGLNEVAVKGER